MLFATRFFLIRIIVFFRNCRKLYFYHSLVVYSFSFKSFSLLLFFRLKFLHYEVFNVLDLSISLALGELFQYIACRFVCQLLFSSFFDEFSLTSFCVTASVRQLVYIIKVILCCQPLFSFFYCFIVYFCHSQALCIDFTGFRHIGYTLL